MIDSGVIYSFVSYKFAKCLSVKLVPLYYTLVVKTSGKKTLVSIIIYKSCMVKVADRELILDLLLLDFQGFNVILGMDWLLDYHVNLEYYKKKWPSTSLMKNPSLYNM